MSGFFYTRISFFILEPTFRKTRAVFIYEIAHFRTEANILTKVGLIVNEGAPQFVRTPVNAPHVSFQTNLNFI